MDTTDPSSTTLAELLARYLRSRVLAPPTAARYDLVVRNLAHSMAGPTGQPSDISIRDITEDALIRFREWSLLRMRPVSFNTERRHLSALFNAAVAYGYMNLNPWSRVTGAPVVRALPKALSKDEITRYLTWLRSTKRRTRDGLEVDVIEPQWFWYTVLRTFYYTGMRRRQLLGLIWDDLDFKERTIRLSAASSKTRREWFIPLPDTLANDLLELRRRTREVCRIELGQRQVFCLPLFAARQRCFRHPVMRADNLDNFFNRLRKAYPESRSRLSAHRIRHTTSTILANSVKNLKIVQEQLGHSSIVTTYGYVHPDMKALRSSLEALQ